MAHFQIEAAGAAFENLLYSSPQLIDYQHLSTSRKHYHSRQSHCSEATDDSSDDSDLDESLFDSFDAEHEAYIRILDPRDWKVIHILNIILNLRQWWRIRTHQNHVNAVTIATKIKTFQETLFKLSEDPQKPLKPSNFSKPANTQPSKPSKTLKITNLFLYVVGTWFWCVLIILFCF